MVINPFHHFDEIGGIFLQKLNPGFTRQSFCDHTMNFALARFQEFVKNRRGKYRLNVSVSSKISYNFKT